MDNLDDYQTDLAATANAKVIAAYYREPIGNDETADGLEAIGAEIAQRGLDL